jgi:hypothetical protein
MKTQTILVSVVSLLLVGCNEEEVNALKEQNASILKDKATLEEDKATLEEKIGNLEKELETLEAENSALEERLTAATGTVTELTDKLNTANADLAVAQKEIETIKEVREELLSKQEAKNKEQDINQWNDTIDQILGITDLMRSFNTSNNTKIGNVLQTLGFKAMNNEVDKAEIFFMERKVEATALAYKLPPCDERGEIISSISQYANNLKYNAFYTGMWNFNFWREGGEGTKTKEMLEKTRDFSSKAFDNLRKIRGLKKNIPNQEP